MMKNIHKFLILFMFSILLTSLVNANCYFGDNAETNTNFSLYWTVGTGTGNYTNGTSFDGSNSIILTPSSEQRVINGTSFGSGEAQTRFIAYMLINTSNSATRQGIMLKAGGIEVAYLERRDAMSTTDWVTGGSTGAARVESSTLLNGWNKLEIFFDGGSFKYFVNDVLLRSVADAVFNRYAIYNTGGGDSFIDVVQIHNGTNDCALEYTNRITNVSLTTCTNAGQQEYTKFSGASVTFTGDVIAPTTYNLNNLTLYYPDDNTSFYFENNTNPDLSTVLSFESSPFTLISGKNYLFGDSYLTHSTTSQIVDNECFYVSVRIPESTGIDIFKATIFLLLGTSLLLIFIITGINQLKSFQKNKTKIGEFIGVMILYVIAVIMSISLVSSGIVILFV